MERLCVKQKCWERDKQRDKLINYYFSSSDKMTNSLNSYNNQFEYIIQQYTFLNKKIIQNQSGK